jgi:hypothetical protein
VIERTCQVLMIRSPWVFRYYYYSTEEGALPASPLMLISTTLTPLRATIDIPSRCTALINSNGVRIILMSPWTGPAAPGDVLLERRTATRP